MIDFDTSRLPSKPSEWRGLLEAVRDADPNDEGEAFEWKSSLDWGNKEHVGGVLARAILGMANRPSPPPALGGAGLVIVGLAAGSVAGIVPLDPADLESKLRPYLGEDGPNFDPHPLTIDGKSVLAIEVPIPPPGSPIYLLRKEVGKYLNGAIFVRNPGRTDHATASQIDALMARAKSGPSGSIDIEITLDVIAPLPHVVIDEAAIEAFIDLEEKRLLGTIETGRPRTIFVGGMLSDRRTVGEFKKQVDDWVADVRKDIRGALRDFAGSVIQPLVIRVNNLGGKNYPGLHVTLFVDEGVVATDLDTWDTGIAKRLPRRPRNYGAETVLIGAGLIHPPTFDLPRIATRRKIINGEPLIVRLAEAELRSEEKGLTIEDSLVLLVAPQVEGPVTVRWEATSRAIDGIARGEFKVPVSDETLDVLRAALQSDFDLNKREAVDEDD